jgi:MFS family permease
MPTPRGVYAGVAAATVMGQFGIIFAPFLLPFAMAHLGVENLVASRLITCELLVYLVTALVTSSPSRFSARPVAVIGCALYAAGSFATAMAPGVELFLLARLFCGIGGGMALVAANRATASHHNYDRLLAVALVTVIVVAVGSLLLVPTIFEQSGASAAYIALGSLAAVAAAISFGVRRGNRIVGRPHGLRFGAAAWLLVGAYFLSRLSDAALWPYIETFGGRVGFGPSAVGVILAGTTLLSVAALVFALRIKVFGGIVALFLGTLLAKAAVPLIMLLSPDQPSYVVAQIILAATVVLAGQLFLTRLSLIDSGGRLAGFGSTAGIAADTGGLPVTAEVFAAGSFAGVAALSAGIGVLALVICAIAFASHVRIARAGGGA